MSSVFGTDPYALSTFTRETNPLSHPNNLNGYLNFIESAPIPEPASGALTAFGLAGFATRRRPCPMP